MNESSAISKNLKFEKTFINMNMLLKVINSELIVFELFHSIARISVFLKISFWIGRMQFFVKKKIWE